MIFRTIRSTYMLCPGYIRSYSKLLMRAQPSPSVQLSAARAVVAKLVDGDGARSSHEGYRLRKLLAL
jgi:hypothetical protein